jgi:hypothetical protein
LPTAPETSDTAAGNRSAHPTFSPTWEPSAVPTIPPSPAPVQRTFAPVRGMASLAPKLPIGSASGSTSGASRRRPRWTPDLMGALALLVSALSSCGNGR